MNELVELADFLRDRKPEVRKIAVQALAQYCGKEEYKDVFLQTPKLIPGLLYLLSDSSPSIQKDALLCLLQLSTFPEFCEKLIEKSIISRLFEFIKDTNNSLVELHCMILANITRFEKPIIEILQLRTEQEGFFITILVDKFCSPQADEKNDAYQWLANVFTNVTQLSYGKSVFTDEENSILLILLPHIFSPNLIRKRGIASTIKNCVLNGTNEYHNLLIQKYFIFSYLISPFIVGNGNYSKEELEKFPDFAKVRIPNNEPEKDLQTKKELLESLCILISFPDCRKSLRNLNIYPILREFDLHETDENVKEGVLKVVELIIRDEEDEKVEH